MSYFTVVTCAWTTERGGRCSRTALCRDVESAYEMEHPRIGVIPPGLHMCHQHRKSFAWAVHD